VRLHSRLVDREPSVTTIWATSLSVDLRSPVNHCNVIYMKVRRDTPEAVT